jgi:WD40 repeat protein
MSLAPDNSTICTASADETLRFWKVFETGSSPFYDGKQNNKLNLKEYSLR